MPVEDVYEVCAYGIALPQTITVAYVVTHMSE